MLHLLLFLGEVVLDSGVGLEIELDLRPLLILLLRPAELDRLQLRKMILDELKQHLHMLELLQILRVVGQPRPDLLDEPDLAEDLHPLRVNW